MQALLLKLDAQNFIHQDMQLLVMKVDTFNEEKFNLKKCLA